MKGCAIICIVELASVIFCGYCKLWNVFQLSQSDDLDNDIDELLQEFESRCQRTILHTLLFY